MRCVRWEKEEHNIIILCHSRTAGQIYGFYAHQKEAATVALVPLEYALGNSPADT